MKKEAFALHYETRGNRNNPSLVLLHGFMGSSKDWGSLVDVFSAHYYCVAVDLPGHGSTAPAEDTQHYTLAGASRGVINTLDELQISQSALLGYSMGGRVALNLALSNPEYFSKVILESATPGIPDAADREARRAADEKLAKKLESVPLEVFLKDWYQIPLFATLREHPEVLAEVMVRRLDNRPSELAKSLRFMGTGFQDSLWDKLSQLQTELYLLTGESDQKFKGIAEKMGKSSDRIVHHEVLGAGHNIHIEVPDEYVRIVAKILQPERKKAHGMA